jgi:hypothetical protein
MRPEFGGPFDFSVVLRSVVDLSKKEDQMSSSSILTVTVIAQVDFVGEGSSAAKKDDAASTFGGTLSPESIMINMARLIVPLSSKSLN